MKIILSIIGLAGILLIGCSSSNVEPTHKSTSQKGNRYDQNGCLLPNVFYGSYVDKTVSWTGECVNGVADGKGTARIYKRGVPYADFRCEFKDGKKIKAVGRMVSEAASQEFSISTHSKGAFPADKSVFAKSIPKKYLVRTSSGCVLVNPVPRENESITWTGKCVDGLLHGNGQLQWYKNGRKSGTLQTKTIYNGMFGLSKKNFAPKMPILQKSNTSGKCYFMLPSQYVLSNSPLKKYFNVEFIGGCKNNKHNNVNIYFNNKLYAVYKGKIYRESLPVNGRLEMFNGNIYKVGAHNGDRYATSKTYQDWIDGLHVLSQKSTSDLNVDDFLIKIGFNSVPTPVKVDNMSVLGFNIGSTSTKNSIELKYNIQPKSTPALTQDKYLMKLEVKIPYTETMRMGFMGTSKKKVIYDYVAIELDRDRGFSASGAEVLKNMQTYVSSMGVKITKSDFKPTVKVISIKGR